MDEDPFRTAVDRDALLAGVEPIASVDDLAMDDLTDDEAEALWAALESPRPRARPVSADRARPPRRSPTSGSGPPTPAGGRGR